METNKIGTYVVGIERFPISRVLQEEALEAEDLADRLLGQRSKDVYLEVVDVVVANRLLEDRVELVQDLDPCI